MPVGCSDVELQNNINFWYEQTVGSIVTVTGERFDADGLSPMASDEKEETIATKVVFTITAEKYFDGTSTREILILKEGSDATITINLPDSGVEGTQVSGAPLRGMFHIECVDADGFSDFTDDMWVDSSAGTIEWRL
jgi:hypothetical protein